MSNIIFHKFDPAVYPRKFWVCVGGTEEDIKEKFKGQNCIITFNGENSSAAVFPVIEKESGYKGALVLFNSTNEMTCRNIAHESVHVADYIFEELSMVAQDFTNCNEQYAYLVGWAANCMTIVYEDTLKETENSNKESHVDS